MTKLILEIIRLVLDIIDKACSGDDEALEMLKNLVPENMKTDIVARIQDEIDLRKFGPRIERE
jgi:hypothetical protein